MSAEETDEAARAEQVNGLLEEIIIDMRETQGLTGRSGLAPRLVEALRAVPREAFVPEADRARAYLNVALPIGHGQTISQPYVVALMLELLDLTGRERVLEIGAGSGYLTALLARLAREVYAVELQPELADNAGTRLGELGVENVALRCADGRAGWPEAAPFGAIIVNAAAPEVPAALMEQLKPGGRLIMPLGEPWATQELTLIEHPRRGEPRRRGVLPVAFVPLLSEGEPA